MNRINKGIIASFLGLLVPQFVVASDLDTPGPYGFRTFDTSYSDADWGTFKATILHPTESSGAPFPGVIVASGWASDKDAMDWVAKHLVSHGYIVLAYTPPLAGILNSAQWSAGFRRGIDTLIQENSKLTSPIFKLLDDRQFGVIGLSAGGGGTLQAAAQDSRIKAAVGLAPYNADGATRDAPAKISAPTQLQVGTLDILVPAPTVLNLYDDLAHGPREYLTLANASHITFTDAGSDAHHKISQRYFTAWFEFFLKSRTEFEPLIFGDPAQMDRSSGLLGDLRFDLALAPGPVVIPPASGGCSMIGMGGQVSTREPVVFWGLILAWISARKGLTRISSRASAGRA